MINNYISALRHYFMRYQWRDQVFEESLIKRLMQGLQYSIPAKPRPNGLFSLPQIKELSQLCQSFESTLTYRAAFLLAFYGLFRISNLAPVSSRLFDKTHHLLHSDMKFEYPGVHVRVKWVKNIQDPEKQHWLKLPAVRESLMCPVSTLSSLLITFYLKSCEPLLLLDDYHLLTQSHLRSRLATFYVYP